VIEFEERDRCIGPIPHVRVAHMDEEEPGVPLPQPTGAVVLSRQISRRVLPELKRQLGLD
jgi:hypothetical protein